MIATRWLLPMEKQRTTSDLLVDGLVVELVDEGAGNFFVLKFQQSSMNRSEGEIGIDIDELSELGKSITELASIVKKKEVK